MSAQEERRVFHDAVQELLYCAGIKLASATLGRRWGQALWIVTYYAPDGTLCEENVRVGDPPGAQARAVAQAILDRRRRPPSAAEHPHAPAATATRRDARLDVCRRCGDWQPDVGHRIRGERAGDDMVCAGCWPEHLADREESNRRRKIGFVRRVREDVAFWLFQLSLRVGKE